MLWDEFGVTASTVVRFPCDVRPPYVRLPDETRMLPFVPPIPAPPNPLPPELLIRSPSFVSFAASLTVP